MHSCKQNETMNLKSDNRRHTLVLIVRSLLVVIIEFLNLFKYDIDVLYFSYQYSKRVVSGCLIISSIQIRNEIVGRQSTFTLISLLLQWTQHDGEDSFELSRKYFIGSLVQIFPAAIILEGEIIKVQNTKGVSSFHVLQCLFIFDISFV